MFAHAGSTEVIALAAHGDDQRIVRKASGGVTSFPSSSIVRSEMNLALAAVEPNQLADAIAEMMPMRLRQKIDLMHTQVHAAGRDLVQERLPQVSAVLVDQRHVRQLAPAQFVAEPGYEFEPTGAAANDDNAMEIGTLACHGTFQAQHPVFTRAEIIPQPVSSSLAC